MLQLITTLVLAFFTFIYSPSRRKFFLTGTSMCTFIPGGVRPASRQSCS